MKIFDRNKVLKTLKIIVLAVVGVLFVWFTFDMTGLRFGQTVIVNSCFADGEYMDFAFWLLFIAVIVTFVLYDKIGKYILPVFLLAWAFIQGSVYFRSGDKLASYNTFFEKTHRIFAASNDFLIKDTYHLFLDIFILLALVSAITFLALIFAKKKKI